MPATIPGWPSPWSTATTPMQEVQLRGVVIDHEPDPDLVVMDQLAQKYTGERFPWRDGHGRVALVIEVLQARHHELPFDPPQS